MHWSPEQNHHHHRQRHFKRGAATAPHSEQGVTTTRVDISRFPRNHLKYGVARRWRWSPLDNELNNNIRIRIIRNVKIPGSQGDQSGDFTLLPVQCIDIFHSLRHPQSSAAPVQVQATSTHPAIRHCQMMMMVLLLLLAGPGLTCCSCGPLLIMVVVY